MILDSANEAAKLVRQLLQLSRPAALEMAPCDLGSLVADAGDMLSYRMRKTATMLALETPDGPLPIMADASQIKQMLLNLMINATDAMEHAPKRELRIHVWEDMGQAVLDVADSGHGIKAEHLSRIFDPFFTTKPPNRGTGLGLSVCLSIVRQHKGRIAVDSTVGVGTRFRIRLPLAPAGVTVAPPGEACSRARGEQAPNASRFRVMIVDDEPYITSLVQETVRRALGWQVERVHNGRHAIERIENDRFDMLISDVRMADVDGLALYRWVQEHHPDLALRTLFVTGDAGSADLTKDLQELGQPVLYKPFTADELVVRCRQLAAEQPTMA
jgi:two-component system NtrC family sensor kinase